MKSKSRSQQREITMKVLYQIFIYKNNNIEYTIDNILNMIEENKTDFITNLVQGVLDNKEDIDNLANKYLKNWKINRLGTTDRAILRMAIYEMKYTDTPKIVCINEALELSKKYSDDKVKNMINSILDKIYNETK